MAPSPPFQETRHLVGIQSLRGIAAVIVVFYHIRSLTDYYLPPRHLFPSWFEAGDVGVDIFFVISGFIMSYVTPHALRRLRDQGAFLLRRFARIYPAYWAVIIPMILVLLFSPAMANGPDTSTVHLLCSIYLLPQNEWPILGVSWTLVYELYFYLVASLLFRWSGPPRLYASAAWFCLIIAINLIHPSGFANPVLQLVASPLCLEFVIGSFLSYVVRERLLRINYVLATAIVVLALASILFSSGNLRSANFSRILCYGLPSSLIVWIVLQMETQARWLWLGVIAPVGDRSFSIYLLHIPVIGTAYKLGFRFFHAASLLGVGLASLGALLIFIGLVEAYYRLVEKPSHLAARRLAKRIEQSGSADTISVPQF